MAMADHERRNREAWDGMSDWYQSTHGGPISEAPAAWGMFRLPEAQLRLLPPLGGASVLELGCGAAQWSAWLARQDARVTGLDLSARQLDHARDLLRSAGTEVRLLQASAEALPLGADAFDLVLSDHGAMSWADPARTLPEVARVLKPDSLLVFCTLSPLFVVCADEALHAAGDRLRRDYFGMYDIDEGGGARTFCPTYGEWVRLFRENGLTVEALVELRQPAGASSTFYPVTNIWPQRWPAELIWKVRKEP